MIQAHIFHTEKKSQSNSKNQSNPPSSQSNHLTSPDYRPNHLFAPSNKSGYLAYSAAFLACFLLAFIAGSFIIQPQGTKAATNLGLVTTATMSLSTGSSTVGLTILPTSSGTLASTSHSLTATTNVPTGYNLTLSTPTTPALTTTQGTITSPTALANNTWGYALARTGAVGVINNFDTSYAIPTPSTSSKWANPSTNTTIKNTSTAATGDTTNIYYGVKANVSLSSGTYTNTVRYTATANIATIPVPTITSITPDNGVIAGGTHISIIGTGFTVNNQSVTTGITIDGQTCTSFSLSSNTPTTGKDTITCNTPAHSIATVDVKVTTWGGTATKAGGYRYKTPAIPMQEVTMENCTTTRTLAYDARDNRTYWVQKMADGRCWMLTNLAYAGDTSNGGTNTYNDAKTISNGEAASASYTDPYYYVPTGSNETTNPTDPSTSTDGGTTNPQYGYFYNWCAAMGVQTSTSACANSTTPMPDISISICPAGWRLPTSNTGGEFQQLTDAIGATTNGLSEGAAGRTNLESIWLATYSGYWNNGLKDQGGGGGSWSSTQLNASASYMLAFNRLNIDPDIAPSYTNTRKQHSYTVRCVLDIPAKTGDDIQTVTTLTCPSARIRVRDARDDATYWIQKMADGRCWMLTNLAYGGGGDNTYGDTKSITNNESSAYAAPYYMIPAGSNKTTGTTDPSTSTDGGTTNPQYGYLYNWCAAMGAQTTTSACDNEATPLPDQNISICPAGWRLPTSNTDGEFRTLTDAIGATINGSSGGATSSTNLKSAWLAQYSGVWYDGFIQQDSLGYFWSSTQYDRFYAYNPNFDGSSVTPLHHGIGKSYGRAVRCIAI